MLTNLSKFIFHFIFIHFPFGGRLGQGIRSAALQTLLTVLSNNSRVLKSLVP
jgi:hypothetical protein